MNKRDIVIGIVILVAVSAIIYFVRRPKVTPLESPVSTPSVEEQIESKFKIEIPEDRQKTELKDLKNEGNSGIASRIYENGKYNLTVLADLPDLQSDEFYQVWIVRGETGESNFSIIPVGKMGIAKGGFLLEFNSNKDYSDYQNVVVSLEKKLTSLPENKILEGSF